MKQINFLALLLLLFSVNLYSQESADASRLMESAEKQFSNKFYAAALDNVNKAIGMTQPPTDNMLYLKTTILNEIYTKDNKSTVELENTLAAFFKQVNQLNFPELKYAQMVRINTTLQQFKRSDNAFSDSASSFSETKDMVACDAMKARINNYLKMNPNTYNKNNLQTQIAKIDNAIAFNDRQIKNKITDSAWLKSLRRAGKGIAFNFSYSMPGATIKAMMPAISSQTNADAFFGGKGNQALSAKFGAGMSIADVVFNLFVAKRIKLAIDWNVVDLEFYQFDYSNQNNLITTPAGQFNVVRGGTRIGPEVTFQLAKKIFVSVYYSLRPAVDYAIGSVGFNASSGSSVSNITYTGKFEFKPNLGNEFGAKLRFGKFTLNPFVHSGNFMWAFTKDNGSGQTTTLNSSYSFNYTGIRIAF